MEDAVSESHLLSTLERCRDYHIKIIDHLNFLIGHYRGENGDMVEDTKKDITEEIKQDDFNILDFNDCSCEREKVLFSLKTIKSGTTRMVTKSYMGFHLKNTEISKIKTEYQCFQICSTHLSIMSAKNLIDNNNGSRRSGRIYTYKPQVLSDEYLEAKVKINDLSTRSRNMLHKHREYLEISNIYDGGITVSDLRKLSMLKLNTCYGLGVQVISELTYLCRQYGVELK